MVVVEFKTFYLFKVNALHVANYKAGNMKYRNDKSKKNMYPQTYNTYTLVNIEDYETSKLISGQDHDI